MVYYRKYRPQLISELDLSLVRDKLTSILNASEIPHAFLFEGPKGLGKTSSARILAKAINCTDRKKGSVEPCNLCSSCVSITNGSAVDVLEIDAASNRGIDEIRDLKERIKFSPSQLKKKIYIIDEVHMLTPEAFNALLKTLEEPPSHVVFILATTEIGKLPGTILSRVFSVRFEKPTKEEIARSLKRVADGEKLEVEKGALEKIGELSDGAFRDGAKILEELSLHTKGKKITMELLETLYKTGSMDNSVDKLVDLTLAKNLKEAMEVIESLASTNSDFKLVIEKIADILHARLIASVLNGKTSDIPPVEKLLRLFDEAYKDLKGAVLPQLPLEIAILEYTIEDKVPSSPFTVHSEGQQVKQEIMIPAKSLKKEDKLATNLEAKPTVSEERITNNSLDFFKQLVDSINAENKILAGLLRGCRVEESSNGTIILKAPSPFHYGKLSESKNRAILEQTAEVLLGKPVAIEIKT